MWTDNYKKNNYMSITLHYKDQLGFKNRLANIYHKILKLVKKINYELIFTQLSEGAIENDFSDLMR